jgi:signal transduction histidine kinase
VVTAHRIKSEFIANMSHELLTPMNGILGFTQALQSTPINRDQRELCSMLEECGQKLLGLIQDVLAFNELEAEQAMLAHEDLNIRDIFLEIRQSLALEARRKNLLLVTEVDKRVPLCLTGDRGKLKQVLAKLASNAIKFTETGRVTLRAKPLSGAPASSHILFEVTDTGVGMSADTVQLLEQTFAQADGASTRRQGGIGAGLTLARKLLKLMRSQLQIASEAGVGSTFSFGLPLEKQNIRHSSPLPCSKQGQDI